MLTYLFYAWTLLFCLLIHTASIPSTAETHTGGDAVILKPEGRPARRHSRYGSIVTILVLAISRFTEITAYTYFSLIETSHEFDVKVN